MAFPHIAEYPYPYRTILDPGHDRAITGTSDTLQLTPAFPRRLYAGDTLTPAIIDFYKHGRAETALEIRLAPALYKAFTPLLVVREAIERLERRGDVPSGSTYQEPSDNPLARLGIRPGDSVAQVNGIPDGSLAHLQQQLQNFSSADGDSRTPLTLTVTRGGAEVSIEHHAVAALELDRSIAFRRDRALELLRGTRELLLRQERFLVDHSQRLSNERGAGLNGPRALTGVWIPAPAREEEEASLAELGLNVSDCVLAVNGTAVADYALILAWLDTAIGAVEEGAEGAVHLRVERDRFQTLNLTWSVS